MILLQTEHPKDLAGLRSVSARTSGSGPRKASGLRGPLTRRTRRPWAASSSDTGRRRRTVHRSSHFRLKNWNSRNNHLESHWLPLSANKACREIKVVVVEKVTLLVHKVFKNVRNASVLTYEFVNVKWYYRISFKT